MAARKLQQDVERTFKRVAEGTVQFESIYDKLQQCTNASQKDKLEESLKREIKKLQRHREQIKAWASNSEIKDKKPLLDQRKLIETVRTRCPSTSLFILSGLCALLPFRCCCFCCFLFPLLPHTLPPPSPQTLLESANGQLAWPPDLLSADPLCRCRGVTMCVHAPVTVHPLSSCWRPISLSSAFYCTVPFLVYQHADFLAHPLGACVIYSKWRSSKPWKRK